MPQNSRLIAETIDAVLKCDGDPPDDDYSPAEFAMSIASRMSVSEVRELACAAFNRLPASLAHSFLDGLLSSKAEAMSSNALYAQIGTGRQVDTTSVIVHLLVSRYGITPDDVAVELLRRLEKETAHEVQDRLAYGIWMLFNSETLLLREGKLIGFLVSPVNQSLGLQLRRNDLSNYAKETLFSCWKEDNSG